MPLFCQMCFYCDLQLGIAVLNCTGMKLSNKLEKHFNVLYVPIHCQGMLLICVSFANCQNLSCVLHDVSQFMQLIELIVNKIIKHVTVACKAEYSGVCHFYV